MGLAAAWTAEAQPPGGHGHRGGGEGGGNSGPSNSAPGSTATTRPARPPTPLSESEIVGVVKAIDLTAGRITIAYEPVAARNWPAGTMPFTAYKSSVLKDATVGERVRFKLDGQQITELAPY